MSRENFINFKQMNQIGKIEKSYSFDWYYTWILKTK